MDAGRAHKFVVDPDLPGTMACDACGMYECAAEAYQEAYDMADQILNDYAKNDPEQFGAEAVRDALKLKLYCNAK